MILLKKSFNDKMLSSSEGDLDVAIALLLSISYTWIRVHRKRCLVRRL